MNTGVDPRSPWEQESGESNAAFEAFARYRDMGPQRSTRAVAQELGKSASLISRWSSKHDWQLRIQAWNREQDRFRRQSQWEQLEKVTERHARIVEVQLEAMMLPAVELSRRLERDRSFLSQLDAKALVDLVCRAARPVAQLIQTERLMRGLGDGDNKAEAEERAFRRELERMSEEELDAALLGLPSGLPASASNGHSATRGLPPART
jgi:hypothetical protein